MTLMKKEKDKAMFQIPKPSHAFKKWEKLIGKWKLKGRTLRSKADNISGWSTFEWMLGGFFVRITSEIQFNKTNLQSVEIIAYDSKKKSFSASVYSSMSGSVLPYEWKIQGNKIVHRGLGARYTGILSSDGTILRGGWRPEKSVQSTDGNTYDAIMTRV